MGNISVSLIKFLMGLMKWTGLDNILSSLPHLSVFHLPVFLLYIDESISLKCIRDDASS